MCHVRLRPIRCLFQQSPSRMLHNALHHYHLLAHSICTVSSLYSNLCAVVSTHQWISNPFHIQIGVYRGDPLSAATFNAVINLLLHTIQSQCHHLGYHFSSHSVVMPALQYADDTALFPIVKRTVKPCWMLHNTG